ncbi:MAG TPA: glucokinase, partial [Xylella fastidiosa subsp. pauca]
MILTPTRDAPNIPSFVAADVGGTHVRVSVVAAAPTCASPPQLLDVCTYHCADYPSLSTILNDFLGTRSAVRDCVIASAGFQRSDGSVIATNLPWPLSPR